jgi:hypothetical protein
MLFITILGAVVFLAIAACCWYRRSKGKMQEGVLLICGAEESGPNTGDPIDIFGDEVTVHQRTSYLD